MTLLYKQVLYFFKKKKKEILREGNDDRCNAINNIETQPIVSSLISRYSSHSALTYYSDASFWIIIGILCQTMRLSKFKLTILYVIIFTNSLYYIIICSYFIEIVGRSCDENSVVVGDSVVRCFTVALWIQRFDTEKLKYSR